MKCFKFAALTATALLLATTATGVSQSKKLCDGFLPENSMQIPVGDHSHFGRRNNGGITEAQYNAIMDRIQSMYGSVVTQRGATLVINRLWSDATVNSSAEQQGSQWIINMYGGIARHPDVTVEGEALIACHEMGHHLGGAPKIAGFGNAWATNEGGADYFATLKCLRGFFAQDDNGSILAHVTIDPLAKSKCESQFTTTTDQQICERTSLASESVAYLFQDLTGESTRPSFSTPDNSQVAQTNDDHPATQCRMDTYFNGSLCKVAATAPNSDTDYHVGTCVQGTDDSGFRPRCWFNGDSGGNPSPNPNPNPNPNPSPGACPLGDQQICDQLCQIDPTFPFCHH